MGLMTTEQIDDSLEPRIQLHEEVRITYIVDSYLAEFLTHDGSTTLCLARGQSPMVALGNLAMNILRFKDVKAIREQRDT